MISLTAPKPYNFTRSVQDHGWYVLSPCKWLNDEQTLQRIERLQNGRVVLLQIKAKEKAEELANTVVIEIDTKVDTSLTSKEKEEIRRATTWMLKLNEDLSEFYQRAQLDDRIWATVKSGRGRLLRSPTMWEDVVKTIATTNVTWANTENMIRRLVQQLGAPLQGNEFGKTQLRAFPTPEQVADADPAIFENEIRMGYRNAYVIQLAQEIVAGRRELEALKIADLTSSELKKELKSIKGVGDYAAHTLMMLLGRYDELAVDSEFRAFMTRHYFSDRGSSDKNVSDQEMMSIYNDWGEWKYLAYWFDSFD
ncbi:hypothetical protein KFU94_36055 [Chloroflexi bacterium TSY]|nr:hypothetical protein [Chloroflexi bacterium TSY]